MPTEIIEVSLRHRTARGELSASVSLCLVCLILCLSVLILLFASDDFAEAVMQMGRLELGGL
jgi:hypothetical protein